MKIVIINKSDSTGGAAVVSRRLMEALRAQGVDARMLVCEKLSDSPYVHLAASPRRIKFSFLSERLKIFLANGLDRANLFKVDTASDGLPLYRHKLVREADAIFLNWVNQGMLSLKGLRDLLRLGKPVIWTMHDMWCFTGICHHAGECKRWQTECGLCKFLGKGARPGDLSFVVRNRKDKVYHAGDNLQFVAVSNWLARQARESSLLADARLSVIPNAFPMPDDSCLVRKCKSGATSEKFRIVMGAARLDDPVKGFPILVEATKVLKEKYPAEAARIELVTFGNFKNPASADGIAVTHKHLGRISGEREVCEVYLGCDAVVSTSLYETLPGTLVEGQVYGCIPVSFGRGGQSDIVDHKSTGYIAEWSDDIKVAASNIAEGIVWAMRQPADEMRRRMLDSARSRFAAEVVAERYLKMLNVEIM